MWHPKTRLLGGKVAPRREVIVLGIHAEIAASRETCFPFHSVTLSYVTHISYLVSLSSNLETKWGSGLSHWASQKHPEPPWGQGESGVMQSHSQMNAWCGCSVTLGLRLQPAQEGLQVALGGGRVCTRSVLQSSSKSQALSEALRNTGCIQGACSSPASVYPTIRRMSFSQNHHPQSHQMAHGRKVGSAQRTDDKWQAPDVLQ